MKHRRMAISILIVGLFALVLTACGGGSTATPAPSGQNQPSPELFEGPTPAPDSLGQADYFANVLNVSITGGFGEYNLSVTVSSLEIGCSSYADWWEVVSEDGELLMRRVLLHSHVSEQPFTRSDGPLRVKPDAVLIVRAHMSKAGYGGAAMRGTVAVGFSPAEIPADFAAGLEKQAPLPTSCAF